MIRVRSPADLALVDDTPLRRLLLLRMSQLGDGDVYDPERHGELLVVEAGDGADDVEVAADFPIVTNVVDGARFGEAGFVPACEFIERHSTCFEMVFAVGDTGFAVFVPDSIDIDPLLRSLCAAFTTRTT